MPLSSSPRSKTGAPVAPSAQCQQVRDALDALVDGEVDAEMAGRLTTHLLNCADCGQLKRGLQQLLATVERSQIPVLASRRLRLRVAQLFHADAQANVRTSSPASTVTTDPTD